MPKETEELMDAVGNSFGIQDAPTTPQQDDSGESDDGQQEATQGAPQGEQGGEQVEDGSTPHKGGRTNADADKEQLFTDKPKKGPRGELLGKNGEVIASSRREKQLAYNLNRTQYAANQVARENKRLMQVLGSYQGIDKQIKETGLSHQMVQEALQLRAMAEKDPITAVRDVVARVLATGVTMEQLFGPEAVPNIDARILTNELDRRLGPIEQRARGEQRQVELNERAQEQMERFVNDHPHAETHGVEISGLVANHGLTPERAYFELRSWAERRGFDFTSPLKPQIETAMKQQRGAAPNGARRPSTPGSMRGVAPNSGVAPTNTNNSRGDFRSNTPWRDIASAVFTELNNK